MNENPYAAIRIPDFRLLLAGRLMVTIAVQIQSIAVGWQIYALTKNALSLGLIGLAEALPAITIALYAGHIADRIDRRSILIYATVALGLAIGTLSLLSAKNLSIALLIPSIFAIIALTGFARGFYAPAAFGLLSDIVPRELYGNAAAWNSATWQGSAMAGPIIGGFLYVCFEAQATYLFSALLLIGSLICFFLIKARSSLRTENSAGILENINEGLRFVFANQIILGAMALDLFAVLFGGAVALLPIFADQVFQMGPQALGIMRAAPSAGALLAATILTHRPISTGAGRIFLVAVAAFGLCMIAFGLSTNFYLSLFLLALSGAFDGINVYLRNTIYQLSTPDDMKGRVAAVNSMFINSSNEIGAFESGVAAKLLGVVPSVVFGGCMTLLVVLVTTFKAPKLRDLNMQSLYKEPES
ncbi:MAG: MFS transporter [Candidatus Obscuribacterales bacterium]|nr:MFS transporter [Candidatus Obscuribacterales bacterium]